MKIKFFFLIATFVFFGAATPLSMAKDFKASIVSYPGIATAPIKVMIDAAVLDAALAKCVNPIVKLKITAQNTQKTAARFNTVQLFGKDGLLIGQNKANKTDALALTPITYSFDFPLSSLDAVKGVAGVSLSFIDAGGDDSSGKIVVLGALLSVECQVGDACIPIPDAVIVAPPLLPPTIASIQTRPIIKNLSGVATGGATATAGPLGGGTFADGGGGQGIWANPGNAATLNSVYATNPGSSSSLSNDLQARSFGFSIPSTATINGIEFIVTLKSENGVTPDNSIKLVKAGTAVGTDFARASTVFWPTSDTAVTFGGPTQLAGVSWTPADINNTNFGVNISNKQALDTTNSSIDYISVKIYYTTAGASVYDTVRGFPQRIIEKFFCALLRQKCAY